MQNFIRNILAGYEPVMTRSIVLAIWTLLSAYGLVSGDLPLWAEASLVFAAFIFPIINGWLTRRKVTSVAALDTDLPDDQYPIGYTQAVELADADIDHEAIHPPLVYDDDQS